ncbi:hypothetical protein [Pseudonocardia spinosispora]|uniref:hypothetical protein n=1 Tax=Pseudonocardia spinosispora TaxID=103441 RepID=UPI0004171813|nr:hypothetical protein [Pseudonocardia spinosispora]
MTSDNPVADRLLSDARKKADQPENGPLGIAALVVSLLGLAGAGLIPVVGWVLGLVAVVLGVVSLKKPDCAKLGKIGLGIGVVAILVATFFFLKSQGMV